MANQEFYSRIIHKHDTEENWIKAINFIPKQGEIIIYDKDDNYDYERMKIGDGVSKVNDLPFNLDQISDTLADLGAITIDLDGSTEGTVAGIDADTFQGYSIDRFVMYSVGGGDGEEDEITVDADKLGGRPAEDYVLKTEISDVLNGITAEKVTMASGLSLEQTLAGCRIDFIDADGNPTDEPYIHWFVDSETGAAVSQGLPNAEEGEF